MVEELNKSQGLRKNWKYARFYVNNAKKIALDISRKESWFQGHVWTFAAFYMMLFLQYFWRKVQHVFIVAGFDLILLIFDLL